MRTRYRFIITAVVICMILSATGIAAAAYTPAHFDKAYTLNVLGLLSGDSGGNFHLDRGLNRAEMAVMLVRLLGKTRTVELGTYTHPFEDVRTLTPWADKYVGYLYQNNLVAGKSTAVYGAKDATTFKQYTAVVLRALGYSEAAGDFTYDKAQEKATQLELYSDDELSAMHNSPVFYRDHMVLVTYGALFTKTKSGGLMLDDLRSGIGETRLQNAAKTDSGIAGYMKNDAPVQISTDALLNKYAPLLFRLEAYDANGVKINTGNGFLVSSTGLAVTSYKNIHGAAYAYAFYADGSFHQVYYVSGYSRNEDIAILTLHKTLSDSAVFLSSANLPQKGTVFAFCLTPGSDAPTVYTGAIASGAVSFTDAIPFGCYGCLVSDESGRPIGLLSSENRIVPGLVYKQLPANNQWSLSQVAEKEGAAPDPSRLKPDLNEIEPNDRKEWAQQIGFPGAVKGTLAAADEDYYKFQMSPVGDFFIKLNCRITLSEAHNIIFTLLDESDNVLFKGIPVFWGFDRTHVAGIWIYIKDPLPSGTYYLKVSNSPDQTHSSLLTYEIGLPLKLQ